MADKRRILVNVILELGPNGPESTEAIKAAVQAALQVGLSSHVQDLRVSKLDDQVMIQNPNDNPPASKPSSKDQVIEEYLHSNMLIRISREAGKKIVPSYFAVVWNTQINNPSGSLIHAKSYSELKAAAEARAERKSLWFERRKAKLLGYS